jgi:1-acyl-sn-glycerol-3-phosphate acyltransferase
MLEFVEPAPSPQLISLVQAFWPIYAKIRYRGLTLQVQPRVLEAFKRVGDQGMIICGNHSAEEDPDVLFGLSAIVKVQLYFLTAREILGKKNSLTCKWLQKIGCFSVERGLADLKSFKTARELLANGQKLSIFPEGEISHQNDFLMELESGPERIAFSALDELHRQGRQGTVFILPVIFRYRYRHKIQPALDAALLKIERTLGISRSSKDSRSERVAKAFDRMLDRVNHENGTKSEGNSLNERIESLQNILINRSESFLKIQLPKNIRSLRRIHILKMRLSKFRSDPKYSQSRSDRREFRQGSRRCERQLVLATSLAGIGAHSFNVELTQEKEAELLRILQFALYARISIKRPDLVSIDAGELIDVGLYKQRYSENHRVAIETLKEFLREQLATAIQPS